MSLLFKNLQIIAFQDKTKFISMGFSKTLYELAILAFGP